MLIASDADVEEVVVEAGGVLVEEVRVAHIGGAVVLGVGVVESISVVAVRGDFGQQIAGGFEEIPELGGGGGISWKAACAADDGNWLVVRHD